MRTACLNRQISFCAPLCVAMTRASSPTLALTVSAHSSIATDGGSSVVPSGTSLKRVKIEQLVVANGAARIRVSLNSGFSVANNFIKGFLCLVVVSDCLLG